LDVDTGRYDSQQPFSLLQQNCVQEESLRAMKVRVQKRLEEQN